MSSTLTEFLKQRKETPKKKAPKKKGGFTMRPLKLLAWKVVFERGGNPTSTREVTKAVLDDMNFAFRHGGNVIGLLIGGMGEGKSQAAFLLAPIWTEMTGGEMKTSWNISDIPELDDGDWLHLDEWLFIQGAGSRLALDSLRNLFALGRAKQICISVSTPSSPGLPIITFEATTLAQDFTNERNLFEIRVPLPPHGLVYVGNAIFPLSKDDVKWAEYELESYKRKTEVVMEGGEQRVVSKLDNLEAAEAALKWASDKEFVIGTKGQAKAALDSMIKEKGLRINYASEENISNLIIMMVRSKRTVGYAGQTIDLREALYIRLQERGVTQRHIEWLRLYVTGEGQTDVAKKFNVTQSAVSKAIGAKSDLRLNNLGYAFEDVWAARLRAEGKTIIKGGENTGEPDILIKDGSGDVIEVQSVKCYISKATVISINIDRIAKSELRLLDEGIPVKLIYYDVVSDQVFSADIRREDRVYRFSKI